MIKSSLLSVSLDVEVLVYTTRPVDKYGVSKKNWLIFLSSIEYERPEDNFGLKNIEKFPLSTARV